MSTALRCASAALAGVLLISQPSDASLVDVRVQPMEATVQLGDPFVAAIVADIPDPVLGFGLDLTFDGSILSTVGDPMIGPLFQPVVAPDGDGLAGLAFPSSVSGSNILLATVMFNADNLGATGLVPGVTDGDLTEGFALDPTGFAEASLHSARVTVVPEPMSAALLALGGLTLRRRLTS